jgi:hypothetical protein
MPFRCSHSARSDCCTDINKTTHSTLRIKQSVRVTCALTTQSCSSSFSTEGRLQRSGHLFVLRPHKGMQDEERGGTRLSEKQWDWKGRHLLEVGFRHARRKEAKRCDFGAGRGSSGYVPAQRK